MSVADAEEEFEAAGAGLVWVLEQTRSVQPGTAEDCVSFMTTAGATTGWCVGDSMTEPTAGVFVDSPFKNGRGFDFVVPRASMTVEYVTTHGTGSSDANPTGAELLIEVRAVIDSL